MSEHRADSLAQAEVVQLRAENESLKRELADCWRAIDRLRAAADPTVLAPAEAVWPGPAHDPQEPHA